MAWLNTRETYGTLSKILHWLMVVMLFMMIAGGLAYSRLELPFLAQANHEIGGKIVLAIAVLRLLLRLRAGAPAPLSTHAPWELALSRFTHWGLYALVFIFPISGWMMVSSDQFAETGALPAWIAPPGSADFWFDAHYRMKWILLGFVSLHIAGALKHMILDRDGTFKRMWFGKP